MTSTANNGKPKTKQRPVHEIRLGLVRAAIWENQTDNGPRHNVTLTRLYKEGEQWKDSTSFGRDDLPLVAKVVDSAYSWIFEQMAARPATTPEVEDEIPY